MCKRKRRKEKQRYTGILVMLAGICVFSLYLVKIALAAPESLPAENGEGEDLTAVVSDIEESAEVSVSGNEAYGVMYRKNPYVPLIAVDPGHGGMDEGCFYDGVLEKDINLQIALTLQKQLEGRGYEVLLLRDSDIYMEKEERVRQANLNMADVYISIHQNIYEDQTAEGVEVWYDAADGKRESRRLAKLVQGHVVQKTQAVERKMREDDSLYVIRETKMPSCLIETGFLSNGKERGLLMTKEYQEQIAQGIAEGLELFFHPKTMYLTFDDGPSPENTAKVLDVLKERNIQATFFVVGENVRRYPELARRIVEEGHTIAIHCNEHNYETLYASADNYLKDFEEAYRAVLEVTGTKAEFFRFPGGSINAYNGKVRNQIIEEMTKRGFVYFDWNASLEDAAKNVTPEQTIENAVSSTLGRKKVVMLAHDVKESTAECLDELLDKFPEYQMKPLTQNVKPVQFQ